MAHAASPKSAAKTARNGHDTGHETGHETGPAADALNEVRDAARRVADDIAAQGHAVLADAQRGAGEAYGAFADAVRRNPTASILGAAGVGLLIGLALRARD